MTELPEPQRTIEATEASGFKGSVCALLTPMMRAELEKLDSGDVLEIRTDEPSAMLDVPSWCRLSGHALLETVEEGPLIRFLVRKK